MIKPASSLFVKVLSWFFLNLILVVAALAVFFAFQPQVNLHALFGQQGSHRLRTAGPSRPSRGRREQHPRRRLGAARGYPVTYHSGPDRKTPNWAKPLAPLPEWLDSVEQILRTHDHRAHSRPTPTGRQIEHVSHLVYWMRAWRERLDLSEEEAADILGYDDPRAIRLFESGGLPGRIPRSHIRQEELACSRWGRQIRDRRLWLTRWRAFLGISERETAHLLSYCGQMTISQIECGYRIPAWEKILVAIAELEHRSLWREFKGPRR